MRASPSRNTKITRRGAGLILDSTGSRSAIARLIFLSLLLLGRAVIFLKMSGRFCKLSLSRAVLTLFLAAICMQSL